MLFYYHLKYLRPFERRRQVLENLRLLRSQLDMEIPSRDVEDSLLLATWNIRDFDKAGNRKGFGKRLKESLFYIAEIISRFDIVAVQEVNKLDELGFVMKLLGGNWDYVATDITSTKLGGNGERLTFLYDKRKVSFKNIAGEIVLPPDLLISKTELEVGAKKVIAGKQFRRTPFISYFQSGWFKFKLCTVHIYYGADSGDKLQQRIGEIKSIAKYLSEKSAEDYRNKDNLILLGDFNIKKPGHETMDALVNNGFTVPKNISKPTNVPESKYYDQIAFKTRPEVLEYVTDEDGESLETKKSGVFKLFDTIMKNDDTFFEMYKTDVLKSSGSKNKTGADLKKYYKTWRTYQLSDHYPMWVKLRINYSKEYLDTIESSFNQ